MVHLDNENHLVECIINWYVTKSRKIALNMFGVCRTVRRMSKWHIIKRYAIIVMHLFGASRTVRRMKNIACN